MLQRGPVFFHIRGVLRSHFARNNSPRKMYCLRLPRPLEKASTKSISLVLVFFHLDVLCSIASLLKRRQSRVYFARHSAKFSTETCISLCWELIDPAGFWWPRRFTGFSRRNELNKQTNYRYNLSLLWYRINSMLPLSFASKLPNQCQSKETFLKSEISLHYFLYLFYGNMRAKHVSTY